MGLEICLKTLLFLGNSMNNKVWELLISLSGNLLSILRLQRRRPCSKADKFADMVASHDGSTRKKTLSASRDVVLGPSQGQQAAHLIEAAELSKRGEGC